jgi:hypothetical protein
VRPSFAIGAFPIKARDNPETITPTPVTSTNRALYGQVFLNFRERRLPVFIR